ncbi:MAG: hypothetical protein EB154_09575, partial [Nitrosopumilaceae archaeon]|nr:hypothetical protein [Nitrosopumilaceae archaeon]
MRSKRVLLIGLKPTTLDYGSFPNLNAERVMQELKSEQDRGSELGYDIDLCLINSDGTDIDIVSQISSQKQ